MSKFRIDQVARKLRLGGVIAYPTEAVYGLGCDPLNADSVMRLLALKQREVSKGLILIAADFSQLRPFVKSLPEPQMEKVLATWPGPFTWIFPAAPHAPHWITGGRDSIAVRVSAHPVVQQLCKAFGGALISTSANQSGLEPARTALQVTLQFGDSLDAIVTGPVDETANPTQIIDAMTNEQVRA
ncbi:MAG: Sua5/YciO/YrdC/YwlC family protein [bacterium]